MGKWGTGKISKSCRFCGQEFISWACKKSIFCSRKCQHKGKKKKPRTILDFKCKECHRHFSARKGRGGTYEFCSIPCMAAWRGRKMSGKNHPKWRGGISERYHSVRKIIKRAIKEKGLCERCESTTSLQGHHKIPVSQNKFLVTEPSNIQVLCSLCHAEEHPRLSGMIVRPRKKFGVLKKCFICHKDYYVPKYKALTSTCCSIKCRQDKWKICGERKIHSEDALKKGGAS